ncbi:hypothetical protein BB559_000689 [Furculomyces boomerangus]|uniref:Bromo domain-containing protein n=1 Tax=Furculomyces boomerangus TaxID=61424 RepID=A0A2T9Z4I7_9FUNG|nr:hypothetical protein BB559_000689 [Furculomyces boomerangus]
MLPPRISWSGKELPRSYNEMESEYSNISSSHILDMLKSFNPKYLKPNPHESRSLLTNIKNRNLRSFTPLHKKLYYRKADLSSNFKSVDKLPVSLISEYRELVRCHGHKFPTFCIIFDRNDKRMITGSDDYLIKSWCTRTGYLIHTFRGHKDVITDMSLNHENTLLASGSSDGTVRVWNLQSGKPETVLFGNTQPNKKGISSIQFSPSPVPEMRYLAAIGDDGNCLLYKWERETLKFNTKPVIIDGKHSRGDSILSLTFNKSGSRLAFSTKNGYIQIVSFMSEANPQNTSHYISNCSNLDSDDTIDNQQDITQSKNSENVLTVNPSSDPNNIYSPSKKNTNHLETVEWGGPKTLSVFLAHTKSITTLVYSNDGSRLLSGANDGSAYIWEFNETGSVTKRIYVGIGDPYSSYNITPENQGQNTSSTTNQETIVVNGQNPATGLGINLNSPSPRLIQPNKTIEVNQVTWVCNDSMVLISNSIGLVSAFDSKTGSQLWAAREHSFHEVFVLISHPKDYRLAVSGGYDGNVVIWDVRTGIALKKFHVGDQIFDGSFSENGLFFAVTGETGAAYLFGNIDSERQYRDARRMPEQMFASDYTRTVLDSQYYIIDEISQIAPHLMDHGLLQDFDGRQFRVQKGQNFGMDLEIGLNLIKMQENDNQRLSILLKEFESAYLLQEAVKKTAAATVAIRTTRNTQQPRNAQPPTIQRVDTELPIILPDDDSNDMDYTGGQEINNGEDTPDDDDDVDLVMSEDENENIIVREYRRENVRGSQSQRTYFRRDTGRSRNFDDQTYSTYNTRGRRGGRGRGGSNTRIATTRRRQTRRRQNSNYLSENEFYDQFDGDTNIIDYNSELDLEIDESLLESSFDGDQGNRPRTRAQSRPLRRNTRSGNRGLFDTGDGSSQYLPSRRGLNPRHVRGSGRRDPATRRAVLENLRRQRQARNTSSRNTRYSGNESPPLYAHDSSDEEDDSRINAGSSRMSLRSMGSNNEANNSGTSPQQSNSRRRGQPRVNTRNRNGQSYNDLSSSQLSHFEGDDSDDEPSFIRPTRNRRQPRTVQTPGADNNDEQDFREAHRSTRLQRRAATIASSHDEYSEPEEANNDSDSESVSIQRRRSGTRSRNNTTVDQQEQEHEDQVTPVTITRSGRLVRPSQRLSSPETSPSLQNVEEDSENQSGSPILTRSRNRNPSTPQLQNRRKPHSSETPPTVINDSTVVNQQSSATPSSSSANKKAPSSIKLNLRSIYNEQPSSKNVQKVNLSKKRIQSESEYEEQSETEDHKADSSLKLVNGRSVPENGYNGLNPLYLENDMINNNSTPKNHHHNSRLSSSSSSSQPKRSTKSKAVDSYDSFLGEQQDFFGSPSSRRGSGKATLKIPEDSPVKKQESCDFETQLSHEKRNKKSRLNWFLENTPLLVQYKPQIGDEIVCFELSRENFVYDPDFETQESNTMDDGNKLKEVHRLLGKISDIEYTTDGSNGIDVNCLIKFNLIQNQAKNQKEFIDFVTNNESLEDLPFFGTKLVKLNLFSDNLYSIVLYSRLRSAMINITNGDFSISEGTKVWTCVPSNKLAEGTVIGLGKKDGGYTFSENYSEFLLLNPVKTIRCSVNQDIYVSSNYPLKNDSSTKKHQILSFSIWEVSLDPRSNWLRMTSSPTTISQATKKKIISIVNDLLDNQNFSWFAESVDFSAYPDYLSVVTYPMCLKSVRQRLKNNYYRHITAVHNDVRQIYKNAYAYNNPGTIVTDSATILLEKYTKFVALNGIQCASWFSQFYNGPLILNNDFSQKDPTKEGTSKRGESVPTPNLLSSKMDSQSSSSFSQPKHDSFSDLEHGISRNARISPNGIKDDADKSNFENSSKYNTLIKPEIMSKGEKHKGNGIFSNKNENKVSRVAKSTESDSSSDSFVYDSEDSFQDQSLKKKSASGDFRRFSSKNTEKIVESKLVSTSKSLEGKSNKADKSRKKNFKSTGIDSYESESELSDLERSFNSEISAIASSSKGRRNTRSSINKSKRENLSRNDSENDGDEYKILTRSGRSIPTNKRNSNSKGKKGNKRRKISMDSRRRSGSRSSELEESSAPNHSEEDSQDSSDSYNPKPKK